MTTDTATPGDAGTSVAWDGADLVITRAFHAPRELVFRAWTEAEHFARWFVPNDFSMPFCTLDPRPGGELHFCHRWPGHEDAWVGGVYDEVVPPERISFACWFSNPAGERVERPGRPSEMHITVTLAEEGGRTLLTARHRGLAEDQGEVQGWTESLDHLAEELASITAGTGADSTSPTADREIVLTRVFDAPRELVFRAWTEPEHLAHWWGPNGFTTTYHEVDVREGGVARFTMHGPDGTDYPNRIVYREIVRPERIVYDHDDDVDDDPRQFRVTVTFADEGGRTRATMRMLFRTAAARDHVAGFGAVELGYQTLDKLAAHLAAM